MTFTRFDRVVLVGAGVWQFISWGGRITLLAEAEAFEFWNWFRIGGSLLLGTAVLLVGLGLVRSPALARGFAWAYLAVALVTWSRSLWVNLTEPNTLGFRLMHVALALVTWTLGVLAVRSTAGQNQAAGVGT
jgi:hypothetical protein